MNDVFNGFLVILGEKWPDLIDSPVFSFAAWCSCRRCIIWEWWTISSFLELLQHDKIYWLRYYNLICVYKLQNMDSHRCFLDDSMDNYPWFIAFVWLSIFDFSMPVKIQCAWMILSHGQLGNTSTNYIRPIGIFDQQDYFLIIAVIFVLFETWKRPSKRQSSICNQTQYIFVSILLLKVFQTFKRHKFEYKMN